MADVPMLRRRTESWFHTRTVESQASWARWRRRTGVNVWRATDGTIGTGPVPSHLTLGQMWHGGHVHVVSEAEAVALTDAGWGQCLAADVEPAV